MGNWKWNGRKKLNYTCGMYTFYVPTWEKIEAKQKKNKTNDIVSLFCVFGVEFLKVPLYFPIQFLHSFSQTLSLAPFSLPCVFSIVFTLHNNDNISRNGTCLNDHNVMMIFMISDGMCFPFANGTERNETVCFFGRHPFERWNSIEHTVSLARSLPLALHQTKNSHNGTKLMTISPHVFLSFV